MGLSECCDAILSQTEIETETQTKTKFNYLEIGDCSFPLFFALVYKDLNYVQAILLDNK